MTLLIENNKFIFGPSPGHMGKLASEHSAVLDVHSASRRCCSPSHPVPTLSLNSTARMQQTILQQRHNEGKSIKLYKLQKNFMFRIMPFKSFNKTTMVVNEVR